MAATTQKKTTKSSAAKKGNSSRGKKPAQPQKRPVRREVWGVVLLVLTLCTAVSYFKVSAIFLDWFAALLKGLFGYGYWLAARAAADGLRPAAAGLIRRPGAYPVL